MRRDLIKNKYGNDAWKERKNLWSSINNLVSGFSEITGDTPIVCDGKLKFRGFFFYDCCLVFVCLKKNYYVVLL